MDVVRRLRDRVEKASEGPTPPSEEQKSS